MPYLPYKEPGITVILSLTSFVILLNIVRYAFDRLLYCGLIGEILIGIIWGFPVGGTAWLSSGTQNAIQAFGYLGLIGLVFEGGLSTDPSLLRKTMISSVAVATVGLSVPIGLSFLLLLFPFQSNDGVRYPTPLAGFSAGASLCSTSLGTTFAILSSAGLQKTRTGVLLVGAAMMDDVVGLVMVNIVTTLGSGGTGGWPIARPIAASFGMLIATMLITPFVLKPSWSAVISFFRARFDSENAPRRDRSEFITRALKSIYGMPHVTFMLSTMVLIIYVTIAAFIDGSVLFAAFLAGGVVNSVWVRRDREEPNDGPSAMYQDHYKPVLDFVLVPFFFASIGFSIPITSMFTSSIVWKGIAYAFLMMVAKAATGLVVYGELVSRRRKKSAGPATQEESRRGKGLPHGEALLVGFAMVARGEIGFLIASLSQSSGTLMLGPAGGATDNGGMIGTGPGSGEQASEDLFLVVVWSVVLCTIVGPVAVGTIVRRQARRNAPE